MNTILPILTDDNLDAFWEALWGGEETFSVNLLDANPDVAAQVTRGTFEVTVTRLVLEGVECWASVADDGAACEAEAGSDFVRLAENQPEARAHADEFIMDWKRSWGLVL